MSLYEYDLFLIRELGKGELLNELIGSGLLQPIDDEEASILGQINCFFYEAINQIVPSCPLRIVKLELDDVQLEQVLHSNSQAFISWLQETVRRLDVAYAFIAGGSSSAYYEEGGITSEKIFRQVGYLVETGTVEIVHPVMFFAERIGQGKACELAAGSPYTVYKMPKVGCLLLFIDGNLEGSPIDILDPGSIYPRLSNYFQQSMK
jgi:hypothetical protein